MRARLAKLDEGVLASQGVHAPLRNPGIRSPDLLVPPPLVRPRTAAAVTRKVLQHPWYQQAQRLSIYVSMPSSELRTDAIVLDALGQGAA